MLKQVLAVALTAAVTAAAAAPAFADGDAAKGEKVFRKCKACHMVGEKAKNRVGPVLNGVVGRASGSVEDFKYSTAMKESGLTWDSATLHEYLENPKGKIPKNKMIFAGLKKQEDRDDVIAYLAQFGPDGKPAEAK